MIPLFLVLSLFLLVSQQLQSNLSCPSSLPLFHLEFPSSLTGITEQIPPQPSSPTVFPPTAHFLHISHKKTISIFSQLKIFPRLPSSSRMKLQATDITYTAWLVVTALNKLYVRATQVILSRPTFSFPDSCTW